MNIKPCPFCGDTDLIFTHSTPDREGVPCTITCDFCGASGPSVYESPETVQACSNNNTLPAKALDSWNHRE
jgi:Lar family restriction alleviation protein